MGIASPWPRPCPTVFALLTLTRPAARAGSRINRGIGVERVFEKLTIPETERETHRRKLRTHHDLLERGESRQAIEEVDDVLRVLFQGEPSEGAEAGEDAELEQLFEERKCLPEEDRERCRRKLRAQRDLMSRVHREGIEAVDSAELRGAFSPLDRGEK